MKALFDILPVALFFLTYFLAPKLGAGDSAIFWATGVTVVVSLLLILYMKLRRQAISHMQWFSLGLVILMGGLTLLLHDKRFIYWKPTLLYWAFAGILLVWPRIKQGQQPIRAVMGQAMQLPDAVWPTLNTAWGLFFIAQGILNLAVAFGGFREATWVSYKLFGATGLMLAFVVAQTLWLSKRGYLTDPTKES